MNLARLAILSTAISTALLGGDVSPLLVDVNWLSSHLNDRGLVILHVGPKADYDAGHISGARYISLEDIALPATRKDPAELTLELPAPEVLRAKFEKFGVSNDSRIVVYFGAKQAFQSSTRVVFTLDYMGLGGQTWILNGGLPAWTAAGKPVTAEVPEVAAGAITARPVKNIVADAQLVKTIGQRPNQRLIDARSPNFYKGVDATYEKKGHIPGAINIPYSELLDSSLMLDRDRQARVHPSAMIHSYPSRRPSLTRRTAKERRSVSSSSSSRCPATTGFTASKVRRNSAGVIGKTCKKGEVSLP